jgi:hypothetical protein
MKNQLSSPPRGVRLIIKFARFGEFKDEYEDFFAIAYDEKVSAEGEPAARRWAYFFAAKTLFFAALEWGKLIAIVYLKVSGK